MKKTAKRSKLHLYRDRAGKYKTLEVGRDSNSGRFVSAAKGARASKISKTIIERNASAHNRALRRLADR